MSKRRASKEEQNNEQQPLFVNCLIFRDPSEIPIKEIPTTNSYRSKPSVWCKPTTNVETWFGHISFNWSRITMFYRAFRKKQKCGIFSVHLKAYTFPRHFIEKSNHRNCHSSSDRQWITGEAIRLIFKSTDIRIFFNSPNTIWRYMGSEIDTISFVNHGDAE